MELISIRKSNNDAIVEEDSSYDSENDGNEPINSNIDGLTI